jgi:glycosyltransferase involved in cell wall biosynthesis
MQLLIVSQYFWPENFRINDLASELVTRGHEVTVLTGLPNYPTGRIFEEFLDNPKKFSIYKGVRIYRVPVVPRGRGTVKLFLNYLSFPISACIFGLWKLRDQKFNAVLTCQLSPVTVGLPGAFLARVKNAPMVMWVLDLWPDTLKAIGVVKSPRLLAYVGMLVGFIYSRCDLIWAQSRSFIPKIRRLAGPRIPIMYFPSWAEDLFKVEALKPAPEVPVRSGCFSIMFAGNIGEAQDFECILSAANLLRRHSNIRWLIVGDGRMSSWVRAEIERRRLEGCVLMFGRHSVERMPEFYLHADAMLVTLADQEIFSMTIPGKLQSYLAAGKPIIAALNGEGADIVRAANAGFACEAGNAVGLAKIALKMAELPSIERLAMGKSGLEFSKREFDRQMVVDMAEECFSGLIVARGFKHRDKV